MVAWVSGPFGAHPECPPATGSCGPALPSMTTPTPSADPSFELLASWPTGGPASTAGTTHATATVPSVPFSPLFSPTPLPSTRRLRQILPPTPRTPLNFSTPQCAPLEATSTPGICGAGPAPARSPTFEQPPQIAYGWWYVTSAWPRGCICAETGIHGLSCDRTSEPPPFGPYFWPCIPPGYALVPSVPEQSAVGSKRQRCSTDGDRPTPMR